MSSNRPWRGFTLAEALVAISVFGLLGLLVALSLRVYASIQLKGAVGTDIDRALSVTAGRLEVLLRGCRVLSPAVGETSPTLNFQVPEVDENGLLVVDAGGDPVWQAPRQVLLQDQKCVIDGADPVVVGSLGDFGALEFERREPAVVRVTLMAGWAVAQSVERDRASLSILIPSVP